MSSLAPCSATSWRAPRRAGRRSLISWCHRLSKAPTRIWHASSTNTAVMAVTPGSFEQAFLEEHLAEPAVFGAHAEAEASVAPILVNHMGRARQEPVRQRELQAAGAEEISGAEEVQRAVLFVDP